MTQLTHTEEMRLYKTDYAAWVKYSAQRWKARMEGKTAEEKRSAWNIIPAAVREELQRMRELEKAA